MTRWLQAALQAENEVLSVSSVLSEGCSELKLGADRTPTTKPTKLTEPPQDDQSAYLSHLREHGPKPYGAVASDLGWGATRAWQAEAKLRASGRIVLDAQGRGTIAGGGS